MTFIVLNPAEQLKKARDSRRLADLRSLDKAIGIYESQTMSPSTGSSTKIYLSLPDTSTTCASYSLPQAPPGYTYACVTEANLRKTNGSGWVPIEFSSIAIGSPLSVLPVDPTNNNLYYYTYVTGGSFMVSGMAESTGNKVSDQAISDGGRMPGTFELGTDLSLGPFTRDNGLVGYWTFDEGTGTTAYDYSGQGNNGTKNNGSWLTGTNCKKSACFGRTINGLSDSIQVNDPASGILDFSNNDNFSWTYWFKITTMENTSEYVMYKGGYSTQAGYANSITSSNSINCRYSDGEGSGTDGPNSTGVTFLDDSWHMATCVMDRSNNKFSLYFDGVYNSVDMSLTEGSGENSTLGLRWGTSNIDYEITGAVDDFRVYNRALSSDEIQAIYNATK